MTLISDTSPGSLPGVTASLGRLRRNSEGKVDTVGETHRHTHTHKKERKTGNRLFVYGRGLVTLLTQFTKI